MRKKRTFSVLSVIVLAATGAWICGSLLAVHDGGWRTPSESGGLLLGLCHSFSLPSASCADVIGSRWGSFDVVLGSRRMLVPTSFIGLCYFTSVGVWFAMVGVIPGHQRWLWRLTLLVVSLGLAGSAAFLGLMVFSLGPWCPPCVIAHALNAGVLILTIRMWRGARRAVSGPADECEPAGAAASLGIGRDSGRSPRSAAPAKVPARLAASAVVAAGAASAALWFYFDAMTEVRRQWRKLSNVRQVITRMQTDPAFLLREYDAQPWVAIPAPGGGGDVGAVEAAQTQPEEPCETKAAGAFTPRVVIFTDYDDPGGACFESKRPSLIDAAFCGELSVEQHCVPFTWADRVTPDTAAPPGGRRARSALPRALSAAEGVSLPACYAAEAARLQGGSQAFETFARLLRRRRKERSGRDYAELARLAGLDVPRFLRDLRGEAVRRRVAAELALARTLGVTAAPTVFLNGRKVPELCLTSVVFWQAVADRASPGALKAAAGGDACLRVCADSPAATEGGRDIHGGGGSVLRRAVQRR